MDRSAAGQPGRVAGLTGPWCGGGDAGGPASGSARPPVHSAPGRPGLTRAVFMCGLSERVSHDKGVGVAPAIQV